MFTKNMSWISILSILFLSFVLYFSYFFLADIFTSFQIYKTVFSLIQTPHFYFILILVIVLSVIVDFFYLVIIREVDTPLYMLFKSLMQRKSLSDDQRKDLFDRSIKYIKSKFSSNAHLRN